MTPELLVKRREGIGGSDVAAILGLSPWKTPVDVYLQKTGILEEDRSNAYTTWGERLEPLILMAYREETGRDLYHPENLPVRHPERPWQLATPDALVVGLALGVEAKTTHARNAWRWEDGLVPDPYLLQVAWYMAVFDVPSWDIAVLIGGSDFRVHTIERNEKLEAVILDSCDRFWHEHVLAGVPPAPTVNDTNLSVLYSETDGRTVKAPSDIEGIALSYGKIRAQLKDLQIQEKGFALHLKAHLGETGASVVEGEGWKASWKFPKVTRLFDHEAALEAGDLSKEVVQRHMKTNKNSRRFLFKDQRRDEDE